jgi:hypothetical protein
MVTWIVAAVVPRNVGRRATKSVRERGTRPSAAAAPRGPGFRSRWPCRRTWAIAGGSKLPTKRARLRRARLDRGKRYGAADGQVAEDARLLRAPCRWAVNRYSRPLRPNLAFGTVVFGARCCCLAAPPRTQCTHAVEVQTWQQEP